MCSVQLDIVGVSQAEFRHACVGGPDQMIDAALENGDGAKNEKLFLNVRNGAGIIYVKDVHFYNLYKMQLSGASTPTDRQCSPLNR
jgi:hypothetical protein